MKNIVIAGVLVCALSYIVGGRSVPLKRHFCEAQ